ncbi:MAG: BrnT family toxin [Chromatiales bacterium]|nr:BrnT family toxin [Chromatiales bacterium]
MDFEWDRQKGRENERKHGVTFEEASQAFGDDFSTTVPDPDHSIDEERFLHFGRTFQDKFVVIAFIERNGRIRIISARPMTCREREAYES